MTTSSSSSSQPQPMTTSSPSPPVPSQQSSSSSSSYSFSALSIIRKRRHHEKHSRQELEWFISEFTKDRIPRYQMSAWLMAACLCPLSKQETAILTRCMKESGSTLQWKKNKNTTTILVDKHSSGGVGDKTSLVLAPWLAAIDLSSSSHFINKKKILVPMMAGRGLGHTGGTIDKLESIPGFNANLSIAEFQMCVQGESGCGCAITSPTLELCPADRKLYALRDVTGTVESVGLQTASILSKKLAENPNVLVLDVKYGQGSFQSSLKEAKELAESMVHTAHANGLSTVALLTRMDHPLGTSVGNWVEVVECVHLMTLHKKRSRLSRDLMIVTLALALEMLYYAMTAEEQQEGEYAVDGDDITDMDACLDILIQTLESGAVRAKFDEMVQAQDGDVSVLEQDESRYGPPKAQLTALQDGMISNIDAHKVGHVVNAALGAGRLRAEDAVDHGAGIVWHKQVGDRVQQGDVLADVYCSRADGSGDFLDQLHASIEYYDSTTTNENQLPPPPMMVTHKVTIYGIEDYVIPPRLIEFANSWCCSTSSSSSA